MQLPRSRFSPSHTLAIVFVLAALGAPRAWAECSNAIDDDGNGLTDWPADPGCRNAADPFEFEFAAGDLLVIDSTPLALLHIDPATGARRVLHSGSPFQFPQGLALDHHHGVLVSDTDADAIFRFDLEDGSLEPVTSGGFLIDPRSVAVAPTGTIYVANNTTDVLIRVNPNTGGQEELSLPGLGVVRYVAVEPDGSLVVAAPGFVYRLDAFLTQATLLSATGGILSVDPAGDVLVASTGTQEALRIVGVLQTSTLHSGAPLTGPRGIAAFGSNVYVADNSDAIYEVSGPTAVLVSDDAAIERLREMVALPATQCANGLDEDGDGDADLADPDCASSQDNAEYRIGIGDVLVADPAPPGALYRLDATGHLTPLTRGLPGVEPTDAAFQSPIGGLVFTDASGNGSAGRSALQRLDLEDGGMRLASEGGLLIAPGAVATNSLGAIFVAGSSANIVQVDPSSGDQTLVAPGGLSFARGVAVAPDGSIYATDFGGTRRAVGSDGFEFVFGVPSGTRLRHVALAPDGDPVVADSFNGEVRRLPNESFSTLLASLTAPIGLDVARDGDVVVSCRCGTDGNSVQRITASGMVELGSLAGGGFEGVQIAPMAADASDFGPSLVQNGDFDSNTAGWQAPPGVWSALDAANAGGSGSVAVAHDGGSPAPSIQQCVAVPPGDFYLAHASFLIPNDVPPTEATLRITTSTGSNCANSTGTATTRSTGRGHWQVLEIALALSPGTQSALVELGGGPVGAGNPARIYIDQAVMRVPEPGSRVATAAVLLALGGIRRRFRERHRAGRGGEARGIRS